jgi:hypothetical protein
MLSLSGVLDSALTCNNGRGKDSQQGHWDRRLSLNAPASIMADTGAPIPEECSLTWDDGRQ